jgi:putative SOS response-associated peptidase YedK
MTRILTIIALLFATPSLAANKSCMVPIDSWEELDKAQKQKECDVVNLLISTKIKSALAVSIICDYSKQIVHHGTSEHYYSYTCVPAK